jgi:AmiR/NasT family two-component response regulator
MSVLDDFDALSDSLGAQKTIEHAKALLMASEGLKDREALSRLRTAATLSGRPLETIAEAIITAFSKK